MQLTNEQKQQILDSFLDNIKGISNRDYQERVWIRGEGPECDDFDETVCDFFGDGNPIIENYKDFEITDHQCNLLVKFYKVFEEFSDNNYWPPEFIDSPEWQRIREMAKEVLEAFNYSKP